MKNFKNSRKYGEIRRTANATGQSIEEKIRTALANNEPLEMKDAPMYTEEKDGILPETDIRTDRWEVALRAADKYNKSVTAKSGEAAEKQETDNDTNNETKNEPNIE